MNEWIISASVLILIITALRFILRGRIKLRLQYALWLLVLLRLLLPFSFGKSQVSVANLIPKSAYSYEKAQGLNAAPILPDRPEDEPVQDNTDRAPLTLPKAETAADTAAPVASAPDIRAAARLLWLIGAALVLAAAVISNAVFALRLRRGRKKAELKCPLPVYICEGIETPCLSGFFRPSVYIPPELLNERRSLEHVLAHELAHFRHLDHIWAPLRCLCLALHWYNPLVWLAAELSKRDGELACDEAALECLGEEQRFDYGRTLISLTCPGSSRLLSAATTMTGSRRSISERIRLLAYRPRTAVMTVIIALILALAAAGCTFTGGKDGAADAPQSSAPISAEPSAEPAAEPRPERYTDSFTSADGSVKYTIDFALSDYSADSMPMPKIGRREFSTKDVQTAAQVIFGDSKLYQLSWDQYTKEELDLHLGIYRQLMEDDSLVQMTYGGAISRRDMPAQE